MWKTEYQVLEYILRCKEKPTLQEIITEFNLSRERIRQIMIQLEKKHFLKREKWGKYKMLLRSSHKINYTNLNKK